MENAKKSGYYLGQALKQIHSKLIKTGELKRNANTGILEKTDKFKPESLNVSVINSVVNELSGNKQTCKSFQKASYKCGGCKTPDQTFHGWWKIKTRGSEKGFCAQSNIATDAGPVNPIFLDQYIFIDTTQSPVKILTTYGTLKYPRNQDALDPADPDYSSKPVPLPVDMNRAYEYNTPYELVLAANPSTNNTQNPAFYIGPTLKIDPACPNELVAYDSYNDYYGLEGLVLSVYKRMNCPPNFTDNLNWNDPVLLFDYILDVDRTICTTVQNLHVQDQDYVGRKKEKEVIHALKNNGLYHKTPIRKIRVTNLTCYPSYNTDTWTTIYTGCPKTNKGIFSFATPGSTIKLSGFTGALSILNGTIQNGVAIVGAGAIPNARDRYLDSGPNGSWQDVMCSFLAFIDTSSLQSIADPATGWINIPDGAFVEVTHKFYSTMSYAEFFAAYQAYYYAIFQTGVHFYTQGYTPGSSERLFTTFSELKTALASNTAYYKYDYVRIFQPSPTFFYHDAYGFYNTEEFIPFNLPYPVTPQNPQFFNEIPLNYLINVQNLYFGIQGTLEQDQFDPLLYYGLNLIPGPGRASFVGKIAPADLTYYPGVLNADPATLATGNYFPVGVYPDSFVNANVMYFGQINPLFTNGEIIGYIYLRDNYPLDFQVLSVGGVFSPAADITNPRAPREGLSSIYSVMFQWFNQIGCTRLIIDQRSAEGGIYEFAVMFSEFLGSDRLLLSSTNMQKISKKKNQNPELIKYTAESKYQVVNQKTLYDSGNENTAYTSLNEKYYPGSVFKGCHGSPKHIIFMNTEYSHSTADFFPNLLIGENADHDLGSHTYTTFIGSANGRSKGYFTGAQYFPVNANTDLKDNLGNPISPVTFYRDCYGYYFTYSKKNIPQMVQSPMIAPQCVPGYPGLSGGNALPESFETTILPDIGYLPNTRPTLPNWTTTPDPNNQTTWRDSWLEAAISMKPYGKVKYIPYQENSVANPELKKEFC